MQNEENSLTNIDQFFLKHNFYSDTEKQKISDAWNFLVLNSQNKTNSFDEPMYLHPLRVASILANTKMDSDCVIAGLLHSTTKIDGITIEQLTDKFGKEIANIIKSCTRITDLKIQNKTLQQADSVRKMLFAMIDDIRVILVKLADILDKIRNLKNYPVEQQKAFATEVVEIWAPLANRLGMSSVKAELEDLSLKYLNPEAYTQIKSIVQLKKGERSDYLLKAEKEIYKAAVKANLDIQISSRAKHFYSIYQKMKKRNKAVDEIYDLFALRIICKDSATCYSLIGLVHTLWKPLDGRFKDYIAMPKTNGYQSLHTTVLCDGFPLEIQIRTQEMHSVAEHGVASHWLYKKGTSKDKVSVGNLSIINQLKELRAEKGNDSELFEEIKDELLGDSIYVFTPKGEVRELPFGSTAIDFAYSIHSRIGETIVGAKADGNIIPLSTPLKNTQIIEILTNPQSHPTTNQLQAVKTARARSKIRAWLLQNDTEYRTDNTSQSVQATQSTNLVQGLQNQQKNVQTGEQSETQSTHNAETAKPESIKIRIGDTTNFLVKAAKCCNPVFGDEIIGYVSRGRGLIIHKIGCSNFLRIPNVKERSIAVVWEEKKPKEPTTKKTKKKTD